MSYIDYVYPTQGSDSMPHFSKGNTLPQISMPWGYNSWVPQTQLLEGESKNWFYSPHSSNFYGLRCSHQPSPWIGDYAAFLMMPQTGEKIRDVPHLGRSGFDPQRTIIKPNLFKTYLYQSNCLFSFSPGYTSGIGNLKFDRKNVEKRLMFYPYENIQGGEHYPGMNAISFNVDHKVPRSVVNNFPLHSYLVFDCDFEFHELENKKGYYISFPANVQTISFKIATSFIDVEQAFHNINYELRDYSIDDVIQWNANEWNNLLGRIDVPNIDEDKKKTFYSCLYRSLLFPKKLHEINPEGEKVHRSPFDGSIHEGPFVAENGFWDTYRTVYPLLSLVYADHLSEIIRGWVNACEEGGWSPK
ncbi:MAG: glycoside hydrolase family 92 protein, partial [Lentisphaeria bacterium]|nr:glycoside hydrolase family 92 protein [Lentisphaeria bacterium]